MGKDVNKRMKKKMFIFFALCLFLYLPKVNALRPEEIVSRAVCPKIELATAKEDGSLESISCHETYEEAKNLMNTTDDDNLVIIESGLIIDAKYAVIDYEIGYPSNHPRKVTNTYIDKNSNVTNGYIKGGTPDEAVLIDYDYNTKRVKIKISGLTGWMNLYDETGLQLYYVVPLIWATTPQYYKVTNDEIYHYFPIYVYGAKSQSGYSFDKKPTMLDPGIYYSYDGHYFYTDMKTLINDYKNNNYNNAVNKDKPYYNYYQYLSFRTKTNYTAENINQYIEMRIGTRDSKMRSSGEYFINAQNNYGINAVLMMAIGVNESGTGTSNIAMNKNNLFGLNAVDSSPGSSASVFASVEDCINNYAYGWLSYGYVQTGDWHYKGANLGNKGQGLNVNYASDPFWGEKAASIYYALDKSFDFQDHNSIATAVLNGDYNNTVYAKKDPNGDNVYTEYYQYRISGSAVAVVGEVEGPSVNGNNIWYKVQSDPTLDINLNYIGDSKSNPRINYLWNSSFVYVPAAYFLRINDTKYPDIPSDDNKNDPTPTPTPDPEPTPEPVPEPKKISAIVSDAKYQYNNGIISGITPNTPIETVKNNLINTGGVITITDANGNTITGGNIGTGMKVNITSGITETLIVLIPGDIDGNGDIDVLDLVALKQHLLGTIPCVGVYLQAANFDNEGSVDVIDLVVIKQYLLSK